MTHTNDDAQTVHSLQTCQTWPVCKPRLPAYIRGPDCIRGNTVIYVPLFCELKCTDGIGLNLDIADFIFASYCISNLKSNSQTKLVLVDIHVTTIAIAH